METLTLKKEVTMGEIMEAIMVEIMEEMETTRMMTIIYLTD
jgi:hypothetical protein